MAVFRSLASAALLVALAAVNGYPASLGSMASELWEALRSRGIAEFAPTFVRCQVFSIQEVSLRADALLGAGVPSWAIELTARGSEAPAPTVLDQPGRRGDFPKSPTLQRANLQLALEAAKPSNLVATLSALDADVLAVSTASSNASRVRLYESICRIAEVEAWPVSQRSARIFAGCLKQGHYRSVKVYFSAVLGHQLRTLGTTAPPEVQRCIADSIRSVLRGAGPAQLKEHFHVPVLRKLLQREAGADGFTPSNPAHWADVLLICSWWMFREVEASAAQVSHVSMNTSTLEVTIMLPVQKTDSRGMLSSRTLKCACRAAVQDLCPYHAMKRHLLRLSQGGREAVASRAPLFPGEDGNVVSKDSFVRLVRATLKACDVEVTKEYEGQLRERGSMASQLGGSVADVANPGSVVVYDHPQVPPVGTVAGAPGSGCQCFAVGASPRHACSSLADGGRTRR